MHLTLPHRPFRTLARRCGGTALRLALLLMWLAAMATGAAAQTHHYSLYVDLDRDPASGCEATLSNGEGSVVRGGFDVRLRVEQDAAGVGPVRLARCGNGAFGADEVIDARVHPLSVGSEARAVDQLEFAVPRAVLPEAELALVVAAAGDYIAAPNAAPIVVPLGPWGINGIPLASPLALALISLALAGVGVRMLRRRTAPTLLAAAVLATALSALTVSAVWAAARIVVDGDIADWAGIAPLVTDAQYDQAPGSPDLLALYVVAQGDELVLRLDAASGRNRAPRIRVAHIDPQATVGVPWQARFEAEDPDDDPLTWHLDAAPAGAAIDPAGQLTWVPAAAGAAHFSVRVTDPAMAAAEHRFSVEAIADDGSDGGDGGGDDGGEDDGGGDGEGDGEDDGEDPLGAGLPRLAPSGIQHLSAGRAWSLEVSARDRDGAALDVALAAGATLPPGLVAHGAQPLRLEWTPAAADVGSHSVTLSTQDAAGRRITQSVLLAVTDPSDMPADPVTRATPLVRGGLTPFEDSIEFLYTGADPIQRGLTPGTLDGERAAVLRGQVRDEHDAPLAGVTVTVWGHPEYGHTQTRADGWFDLAVNGGGILTLDYAKPGYIRAQRKLHTPWRDYAIAEDVVLLALDARATPITLGAERWQLGRGSQTDDERGARTATVLFPPQLGATLRLPDGSTRALEHLTFRATEFTVGERGPAAMPGELPISVGYTYAVELSVDEAVAAGAVSVEFDRPLPVYLENFLDFPVGTLVPSGWYDYQRAAWIGSDNGRVVRILAIEEGLAVLQVGDEERAASAEELAELGIVEAELAALARIYGAGQSLWRVAVEHFTPWDCNWPWGPPDDADGPPGPSPDSQTQTQQPRDQCPPDQCCKKPGCEVRLDRSLGESIDMPGSSSLYYHSRRAGAPEPHPVPLVHETRAVPGSLAAIDVNVAVAGRRYEHRVLPPFTQGMTWDFKWDGRDAYGREIPSGAMARIRVAQRYPLVYYPFDASGTNADFYRAFSALKPRLEGARISPDRASMEAVTSRQWTAFVRGDFQASRDLDVLFSNAGGWSLRGLRAYDPRTQIQYVGGGAPRRAIALQRVFKPVATLEGGVASTVLAAPDGGFYAIQPEQQRIVRIERSGALSVVAEQLDRPGALALGSDGSLYFTDQGGTLIRRIDRDGVLTTVAGEGSAGGEINAPGEAHGARIRAEQLTVDRDGHLFYSDFDTVYQITPEGDLNRVFTHTRNSVTSLAADPRGGLWIAQIGRILYIAPGGDATVLAGGGLETDDGWGTELRIRPRFLEPDRHGGVYFTDGFYIGDVSFIGTHRHLQADGYVTKIADLSADRGAAEHRLMLASDESLWQIRGDRLGVFTTGFPGHEAMRYSMAREDGLHIDVFDRSGRPLEVFSALSGLRVQHYEYEGEYLARAIDGDGNVVRYERDGDGRLEAIVGVHGERTTLAYDDRGRLVQVEAPGGITHRMRYLDDERRGHLMVSYTNPNGHEDRFEFDERGLLARNLDPAGGGWQLDTVADTLPGPAGTQVAAKAHVLTSAEGREYRYTSPSAREGLARVDYRATAPDGLVTDSSRSSSSHSDAWTAREADGLKKTTWTRPDPRFGSLSGSQGLSISHNAGILISLSTVRNWSESGGWSEQTTLSDWRGDRAVAYTTRYRDGELESSTPVGRAWRANVDGQMRPITLWPEGLAPIHYSRDGAGRLTHLGRWGNAAAPGAAEEYQARETVFDYLDPADGLGRLAGVTDAYGARTGYAYDAAGRVSATTLPDGRELRFAYDALGSLIALTTPAGIHHRFRYDAINQPAAYEAPASTTDWHYDRDRLLVGVTRPGGEHLALERDIAGRITRLSHAAGEIDYGYDAYGRLDSADDGANRLRWQRTGSLVTGVEWQGEVNGQVSVAPEHIERLAPKRLSIEAAGERLDLDLDNDAAGRPIGVSIDTYTSTAGLATEAWLATAYTPGNAVSNVFLDRYALSRSFNEFGETVEEAHIGPYTTPALEAMRAAFLSTAAVLETELLAEIHDRGTCARRGWFTRPPYGEGEVPPEEGELPYSGQGELRPNLGGGGSWGPRWVYEDDIDEALRARLTEEQGEAQLRTPDFCTEWVKEQFAEMLRPVHYEEGYAWADGIGIPLVELETAASGGAAAITAHEADATPLTDTTNLVTQNAAARFADLEDLRTRILDDAPHLGFVARYRYERDLLGRIKARSETVLGTERNHRYEYDLAGRLTAHSVDGVRTEWSFDANGNRTHHNGTEIAHYDDEDRLTAWRDTTYAYTAAGELSSRTNPAGTTTYRYDALGSLREVTLPDGTAIDYVIDPKGRRIGRKRNGVLEYGLLYQDALNPIAELDPDGRLRSVFLYAEHAHSPAAMVRDGKLYRFVTDHLGSIRVVIDTTTGTIAQQLDYDVWGKVTHDTNPGFQPFGFAGGVYDPDTGLTRFGARDYDGETGRWTAKDPIGFAGGDANLYGYVLQDPVNWIDPEGLDCVFTGSTVIKLTPTAQTREVVTSERETMVAVPVPSPNVPPPTRGFPWPGLELMWQITIHQEGYIERLNRTTLGGIWRCFDDCGQLTFQGWGTKDGEDQWVHEQDFKRSIPGSTRRGGSPGLKNLPPLPRR